MCLFCHVQTIILDYLYISTFVGGGQFVYPSFSVCSVCCLAGLVLLQCAAGALPPYGSNDGSQSASGVRRFTTQSLPTINPQLALPVSLSGFVEIGDSCGVHRVIGIAWRNNDLFLGNTFCGLLYKIPNADPNTSIPYQVSSSSSFLLRSFPAGTEVLDLAVDAAGNLFAGVYTSGVGSILQLDPATGATIRTVITGLQRLLGLESDPTNPSLLWYADQKLVYKLSNYMSSNPSSQVLAECSPSQLTDGMAIDATDGSVWCSDHSGGGVRHFDSSGTLLGFVSVSGSDGLAVSDEGVISNTVFGEAWLISKTDYSKKLVFSGGTRGDFVAIGPDKSLYLTQTATVLKLSGLNFQPPPTGTCTCSTTLTAPLAGSFQASATSLGTSTKICFV